VEPPDGDDEGAWLVYGDWLQSRAVDERWRALGEAIVLAERAPERLAAFVAAHRDRWVAELAALEGLTLADWRGAFPREAALSVETPRTDDLHALLDRIVRHPIAARLEALSVSLADYSGEGTLSGAVAALVETRRPRLLRRLTLEEPPNLGSLWDTEPPHLGDVGGLWRAFPALEQLTLDGREVALGEVHAPRLADLTVRGVDGLGLDALAAATLPALHTLRLLVAGPAAVPSLATLVGDGRLGALRHLTLGARHSGAHAPILALLPRLAALPHLESLDLSWMRIVDAHVDVIAQHGARLARIGRVRFNVRNLSEAGRARLAAVVPTADLARFRSV
jgi:hypothetical protein